MTRPIYADTLLKTASNLAGVKAGAGRPALADLRRATSTAYYALFHQITRHGAYNFLPNASEEVAAEISRWYSHTGILRSAQLVIKAQSNASLKSIGKDDRSAVMALREASQGHGIPSKLIVVADSFQSLQNARHRADYDSIYDPFRPVTLSHVADATAAVKASWWLWRSKELVQVKRSAAHATYSCFLSLAMMKSGGPKGR